MAKHQKHGNFHEPGNILVIYIREKKVRERAGAGVGFGLTKRSYIFFQNNK